MLTNLCLAHLRLKKKSKWKVTLNMQYFDKKLF